MILTNHINTIMLSWISKHNNGVVVAVVIW